MNNNGLLFFALLATVFLPSFAMAQSDQSSCPNLSRNLFFGSGGDDVIAVQNFLIARDLLPHDDNTGYFGRLTKAAAIAFQKQQHLPTTGLVGQLTRSAIGRVCGRSLTINQMTITNSNASSTNTNREAPNIIGVSSNIIQNYNHITLNGNSFVQTTDEDIGHSIVVEGMNFDPTNNTVLFNGQPVATNVPAEVLPAHDCFLGGCGGPDLNSLSFVLPYSAVHPAPLPGMAYANQLYVGGTYQVSIKNSHGTSNSVTLKLNLQKL